MLFDQEYVRIQENFRRLASAALLGLSGQSARLDTDEGVLELSAYAPGILRLRLEKAVLPDYGLLAAVPETVVTAFEQLPEFYRFSDREHFSRAIYPPAAHSPDVCRPHSARVPPQTAPSRASCASPPLHTKKANGSSAWRCKAASLSTAWVKNLAPSIAAAS